MEKIALPQPDGAEAAVPRTPDHAEHHRMIARNLNGLLEDLHRLSNDLTSDGKHLKVEFKSLDAKLFRIQNEVEKLARSHDKFMEEMTSVAFDTNLELRATRNHVEEIWRVLAEIAGSKRKIVESHRDDVEEREKRRVAEIDRKLQDLADSARKKGNIGRIEETQTDS